ncbi:MAG TPA: glycosyltransferase family 39 protein [Dokdonella sp.]|uniref:ArnT family glycosyltransferase n=1 Tax=Dokdonella sp. TaxID=2291710 RepID=UPI002D7EDF71|nr:glycosyltransferase family 39 protein [Dokdonella sp.]HET9032961.1 glycosyltransferase family 39 protein [Dokdonella sp.]
MKADLQPGRCLHRAWPWLAVAVWLLLNAALLWIYYQPNQKLLVGDEFDYNQRALALLAGQAVPELFIWPPGQTWLIAAIYALFGSHVLAVQIVQIGLLAVCAALLVRLWETLDTRLAALLAGTIFLLNPATLAYAHWLWPEVPFLFCLLGALSLLLTFDARPHLRALLAGLLIGFSLLLKSLLGGLWPLFFVCFVSRKQGRFSVAWLSAAAFAGGLLMATFPALWKGYVETGRPLIADSSVYNLHVGILDSSRSDYIDEAGLPALTAFIESAETPQQRNAIALDKVRALVAERGFFNILGEQLGSQYFRLFNAKTLLASQLPGPRCAGYLGAYGASSLNAPLAWLAAACHSALLVLCAFGLVLWRRWRRPFAAFCAIYLGYQLSLFLGLHIMERYFFQMQPLLCGFAGSFVAALIQRDDSPSALSFTRWRLLVGSLLAALLLGLAWLGPVLDGPCR